MGEVKIKSGNLFDTSVYNNNAYLHNCTVTNTSNSVTITSTGTDPFVGFVNSPGTTVPERAQSMYIPVKPNTAYTIDMSSAPKCYCTQVDDSNVIKKGVQINLLPYRFTTDDSTAYVIIRLGDDTLQTGDSLTFENIQLLEGTYTSETIPEYQPYFLNRPAHQFTNGEWIDIPTHKYTNGRWQGELTSQSPLKFWADGEMLDWRVEGKTSPEPETIVYGIHINPNIQGPSNAVTYLEDAVGMTPASMGSTSFNAGSWADAFFIPKPCMVRYDGIVDYYLDPSDYSKKADGTASDIADPNYGGNAMMEWGLIWFKFEAGEADGEGYFYVSNKKVDDSFNCWCNYDANNSITQHFYTAIYNGTGTDKLRSISGVQLTPENGSGNTTGQQEITRAMANNTSDLTEWYIDLWADEVLSTGLLYLIGKSLNLQTTFGRGIDSGGQTAKESYVTGTLNDKGLFWGDTTNSSNAVKIFGMENRWGCCYHRTAGLFGVPNGYVYKLTHGTIDGSTATEFGMGPNGYIPIVAVQPENGYVTKMSFGKYGLMPTETSNSAIAQTSFYCDHFFNGRGSAIIGGSYANNQQCGFYINLGFGINSAYPNVSTSLSLKPRAKAPYNPHNGVGDWDETEQKYRIPVTVGGVTTDLYTDHQLMDGDSIDYTTTETTIPLETGNNTLTVDTAVQPKSVFVKFEG